MKSFRNLVSEVQMVDTPFERKIRDIHQVQVWDLPPEMSGDDVIRDMPKDTTRSLDVDNPNGLINCPDCGSEMCPDCGNCKTCVAGACDCSVNEVTKVRCSCGKMVTPGQKCPCGKMVSINESVDSVAGAISDISSLWEQLKQYDLDEESLGVVYSDLSEIRRYLAESIPPTTAEPEPRNTDEPVTYDSIKALPNPIPYKTAKSLGNVYKPVKTRYGDVYEAYTPGEFKLKDGSQIKITPDDAILLNTLHVKLTEANAKKMHNDISKNYHAYTNLLEFARRVLTKDEDKQK